MRQVYQTEASFAEILEGKSIRRDKLVKAIQEADQAVLEHALDRMKEVMRKKGSDQKRRRLSPPAFSI